MLMILEATFDEMRLMNENSDSNLCGIVDGNASEGSVEKVCCGIDLICIAARIRRFEEIGWRDSMACSAVVSLATLLVSY